MNHNTENQINLAAPDLFGNDAADHEDIGLLMDYILVRNEHSLFSNADHQLLVAKAYKGFGKSALLRYVAATISGNDSRAIVVEIKAPDIKIADHGEDQEAWIRAWKEEILNAIAIEIVEKTKFAFTTDKSRLVEHVDKLGMRNQNLVSYFGERLKLAFNPDGVKAEFSYDSKSKLDVERGLKRIGELSNVWVIIDDVDLNFSTSKNAKTRISAFLTALSMLISKFPDLKLRTCIRPNVWTAISLENEALSHVRQYLIDIVWDRDELTRMLALRVKKYSIRHGLKFQGLSDPQLLKNVFESSVAWGRDKEGKSQFRPLWTAMETLSALRPRWLIVLCRMASDSAVRRGAKVISKTDMNNVMKAFGRDRVVDVVAEFRSMCTEIESLINAFHDQPEQYSTDALIALINKRILSQLNNLKIVGQPHPVKPVSVHKLLFECGLLIARGESSKGYDHIHFHEDPLLLQGGTNPTKGYSWEIHPAFRQYLNMRSEKGYEVNKTGR